MKRYCLLSLCLAAVVLGWLGWADANVPSTAVAASTAGRMSSFRGIVWSVCGEYGLDPHLIDALVRVESDYNPRALSRKGAMGLMQLMPATARRLDVSDPFDPEQNVRGGVQELARLIDRYSGNLALALAAYNAGEGAVQRHRGVPPYRETRNYVQRIMTLYTGRKWKLGTRVSRPQVRILRDPATGKAVITNQRGSKSRLAGSISSSKGSTLAGGFGQN